MEKIKKQISILIAQNNFDRLAFLKMFRPELRDEISKLIPRQKQPDEVKTKVLRTVCLRCNKPYNSFNPLEDLGKCHDCNFKENQKLLKEFEQFDLYVRKSPKKTFPRHLDKDLIFEIQKYFVNELFGKIKFKNQAYEHVNKKFNLNLLSSEVSALLEVNVLKRAGLEYAHKKYS